MSRKTVRCFVAVPLPGTVLDKITTYLALLKPVAPKLRWVRPANIHITIKFLGETDAALIPQIDEILRAVANRHQPFDMAALGSGFFPTEKRPRVFWLGLEQKPENHLFRIHQDVDINLEKLSFKREKRRFSPHLTLARIKDGTAVNDLISFVSKNRFSRIEFTINHFVLMQSILKPEGAEYSVLHDYELF